MQELTAFFEENVELINARLRTKENFDVIARRLSIGDDEAVFFYIDGLTKDGVLQKLFQHFIGLKELPKGEEAAEIFSKRNLPYVEVDTVTQLETILTAVLSGSCVMLGSTFGKVGVIVDTRVYPARTTEEPDSDRVMQGAHDGFVETLIFNTALIRRRVRDPNLTMHYINLGGSSRTDVVLCFIKGKAKDEYVTYLRKKLHSLKVEALPLGAESLAESLIRRKWYNPFPKIRYTERPDAAAAELMEGRVLLLCDNSPQTMILPTSIMDFMQETDDFYFPPLTGCYLRLLRHFVFWLSLLLIPTWYLIMQNVESLPGFFSIFVPENPGKIPILLQIYMAEIAVDGLKLASMNTPNLLTNSLSVIGGLILGDYAVDIGWLSKDVILYISLVAIANFTQQNYELGYAFKLIRMAWLAATALFGAVGYGIALVLIPILLISNETVNDGY
ncbi:MAG: spore germination protein, partial [Clostridia bacterium]|nr:spore germination protein [Clostridia bacterium]